MKKLIVIALAVVMALAVVAFAACDNGQTVTGTCSYNNPYGEGVYGVEVSVTVKNGVITAVELVDHEGWTRTSADNADHGWTGHDATEAAYANWLESEIVGKSVETVLGWTASATSEGQSVTSGPIMVYDSTTGATAQQSSARIIVAIQDALSKLA